MEMSRQVILDLLPLYHANEASEETRALIEQYLETDPQLARIAKQPPSKDMMREIPAPVTRDRELEAYRRARLTIMWRTIIIAAAIAVFLVLVLAMFFLSSPSFDMSGTATAHGLTSNQIASCMESGEFCCAPVFSETMTGSTPCMTVS